MPTDYRKNNNVKITVGDCSVPCGYRPDRHQENAQKIIKKQQNNSYKKSKRLNLCHCMQWEIFIYLF